MLVLGDVQHDNMPDKARETSRRVEAQERERADHDKRKRDETASSDFKASLDNFERYLKRLKIRATHDAYGVKVSGLGDYGQFLRELLQSEGAARAE